MLYQIMNQYDVVSAFDDVDKIKLLLKQVLKASTHNHLYL